MARCNFGDLLLPCDDADPKGEARSSKLCDLPWFLKIIKHHKTTFPTANAFENINYMSCESSLGEKQFLIKIPHQLGSLPLSRYKETHQVMRKRGESLVTPCTSWTG